ncbi:MAG: hypothetical protein ACOY46_02960 [Bacillota bacterium]
MDSPQGGGGGGDGGGGGGGGDSGMLASIKEWFQKATESMAEVAKGIAELPTKIANALFDAALNLWGVMIDSFLNTFCGILGTAFTHTVYPGSIDWVNKGNVMLWVICLVIAILFLTINIKHVLSGKKHFKPVLATFFIGVVFSVFSVQIVNVIVWVANTASSSLAQGALDTYTEGTMNLDLAKVTAQQVISIPFQDPSSFGTQVSFHSLFLDPVIGMDSQANGGFIALLLAAAEWIVTTFFVAARIIIICSGTILAPVYINMTVWFTRIEPAVGWVALMFRTVFLQVIWSFGWTSMVFIQTQYSAKNLSSLLGASATAINIAVLAVLIFVTYRFWFKPTAAQIAKPVTLAGGVVIEKLGNVGEKIGRVIEFVGMATLQPEIVAAGAAVSGVGKGVSDRSRGMHGGGTIGDSFDLSKEAPTEPGRQISDSFIRQIEQRYEKHQAGRKAEDKNMSKKYWTWNGKYVIRDSATGLPREIPAPPEGGQYQGEWQS